MRDEIVAEVRKVREEFARKFNYDLAEMSADLRKQQAGSNVKVVSFPKRPARTVSGMKANE